MRADLDHLVIAARSLDEGVQWCEATLGVVPGPGGAHPLMGTHNRLLAIDGAAPFSRCYLEIIAIEPGKRPERTAGQHRWFDLDDPTLQAGLAQHGPRLVHFVARVPDAQAAVRALAHAPTHLDRGQVIGASRDTPAGRLEWQITVRDDGQRLFYGAMPTLIQWGPVHPVDSMPPSGLRLTGLSATHPRVEVLREALQCIGLTDGIALQQGAPHLGATLDTPRGPVTLDSKGL
ncbi:MAG: VOC family protein [Pseudomonadota bacterium]